MTFTLKIGGYSGDAGDSMFTIDGMAFSTIDEDNDTWDGHSCAQTFKGAWW